MTQFEQLDLLLNEYGGIIQTFQVIDNGISKPVFYSYVKERGLGQAAHGVYVSPDTWTDAMFILHLRCSQAVFSHETALFFHDLTDREPLKYTITVRTGYNPSRLQEDGFQVYTVKKDLHDFYYQDLKDKVIIVFGGNSGIGKDIVCIAKRYGANCYSFSRSTSNTDIACLHNVNMALQSVYEKEKRIDYVVNTAAVLNKEPIMHLQVETIQKIIDINYLGMVNVTIGSYVYLKESKGSILHFTSSSYTRGRANYALYSSTKAAVVNFVQAIAEEWFQDEISINCINPQRTKTPMRIANFGIEPDDTLLKSEDVALVSLNTLLSSFSGEVVDIKLK